MIDRDEFFFLEKLNFYTARMRMLFQESSPLRTLNFMGPLYLSRYFLQGKLGETQEGKLLNLGLLLCSMLCSGQKITDRRCPNFEVKNSLTFLGICYSTADAT
jgi:hypothetical protein